MYQKQVGADSGVMTKQSLVHTAAYKARRVNVMLIYDRQHK